MKINIKNTLLIGISILIFATTPLLESKKVISVKKTRSNNRMTRSAGPLESNAADSADLNMKPFKNGGGGGGAPREIFIHNEKTIAEMKDALKNESSAIIDDQVAKNTINAINPEPIIAYLVAFGSYKKFEEINKNGGFIDSEHTGKLQDEKSKHIIENNTNEWNNAVEKGLSKEIKKDLLTHEAAFKNRLFLKKSIQVVTEINLNDENSKSSLFSRLKNNIMKKGPFNATNTFRNEIKKIQKNEIGSLYHTNEKEVEKEILERIIRVLYEAIHAKNGSDEKKDPFLSVKNKPYNQDIIKVLSIKASKNNSERMRQIRKITEQMVFSFSKLLQITPPRFKVINGSFEWSMNRDTLKKGGIILASAAAAYGIWKGTDYFARKHPEWKRLNKSTDYLRNMENKAKEHVMELGKNAKKHLVELGKNAKSKIKNTWSRLTGQNIDAETKRKMQWNDAETAAQYGGSIKDAKRWREGVEKSHREEGKAFRKAYIESSERPYQNPNERRFLNMSHYDQSNHGAEKDQGSSYHEEDAVNRYHKFLGSLESSHKESDKNSDEHSHHDEYSSHHGNEE